MGKAVQDTQIFRGRVILVYLSNAAPEFRNGIAILHPQIKELFGQTYIVGVVPDDIDDWASGLRVGVIFDQVVHYIEFDTEDEYFERTSMEKQILH